MVGTKQKQSNSPLFDSLKNKTRTIFQKVPPYERLVGNGGRNDLTKERLRAVRQSVAKSKSGVWGPSHSFDSEDDLEFLNKTLGSRSGGEGTNTTQDDSFSSGILGDSPPSQSKEKSARSPQIVSPESYVDKQQQESQCSPRPIDNTSTFANTRFLAGMWKSASAVMSDFTGKCIGACHQGQGYETHNHKVFNLSKSSPTLKTEHGDEAETLGIKRLSPPSKLISFRRQKSNTSSLTDGHGNDHKRKLDNARESSDKNVKTFAKLKSTEGNTATSVILGALSSMGVKSNVGSMAARNNDSRRQALPFNVISVNTAIPFHKSISELTMKSSRGEVIVPVSDMRRMAYYAVGKNHSQKGINGSSNGGNRKCYFTGDPIINGRPFYAGSVQQGLRTLIVFCLPSALGLPRKRDLDKVSEMELSSHVGRKTINGLGRRTMTGLSTAALSQHDSIYNEEGFMVSEFFHSATWTEDESGNLCENLDADMVVQALPDPSRELLSTMQDMYPEQFESLSPHLRRPQCWKVYVRFCFFSGLPIADGEMYYKVVDEVIESYGKRNRKIEEVALSHEVMEAVNGESADMLSLPGNKTFQYLKKHYKQQCAKLTPQKLYSKVFDRSNWIRVMPEV